jgi:flagellar basal-body rod modification protein FlgD
MSTVTSTTSGSPMSDLMATMNTQAASTAASPDDVQAQTNKFMTLLVTQLKNQDPMNPMDNAQITSQLAQLSTVTGVNKLNTTLDSLKASYQSSETLAATNLIGHGVLVEGGNVALQNGKGVLGVELASAADSVQVVITDPKTGKDVETIDLGSQKAGTVPLAWDGIPDANKLDSSGNPIKLADGNYNFRVVATRAGQQLTDAKGLAYDSVASVSTGGTDGVKINLGGKGAVALADIKQVL